MNPRGREIGAFRTAGFDYRKRADGMHEHLNSAPGPATRHSSRARAITTRWIWLVPS